MSHQKLDHKIIKKTYLIYPGGEGGRFLFSLLYFPLPSTFNYQGNFDFYSGYFSFKRHAEVLLEYNLRDIGTWVGLGDRGGRRITNKYVVNDNLSERILSILYLNRKQNGVFFVIICYR